MSTKYNLITKTIYKDFCEKTNNIQIVENDSEKRRVTLMDKFGNKCLIDYNKANTIFTLTRVGRNDPTYILYLLVTLANAKFLSEDDFKNCMQVPLMNGPDCKMVKITKSTYEGFTQYFMDYVKYEKDFYKEFQLFTKGKRADSKTINDVPYTLEGGNNNALIVKPMGKKQRRTDDYFELDEVDELEKMDSLNQDSISKNNFNIKKN
jgi:hypothetical protein